MKRFFKGSFLLVMALFLFAATGCGKNKLGDETPEGQGDGYGQEYFTPEEQAAKDRITDGIVYFAYDSYDLRADSKNVLSQQAGIMKQYPQLRVVIEGHCDERGTEEYNLALGERRARAAYEFMINLGVPASQMEMVSFGKLHPRVMGGGESSWAQNRRDEFKVTKTAQY